MVGRVRCLKADRSQLRWDMVDLDGLLVADHRARVVWSFVESLDLTPLYEAIKAREDTPGRPPADPAVLLALWLYATLEGVGAARQLERLCTSDIAYRWLCGGVSVNYHGLSDFRAGHGAVLDKLLTESLAAMAAEGLVKLDEIAIDGTKVRASAGKRSFRGGARLEVLESQAQDRVAALRAELESDPGAGERRRKAAQRRAADDVAARAAAAKDALAKLRGEKEKRARRHRKAEAAKAEPKASTTDPEARMMRFADGAVRAGYNVQLAVTTEGGLIVGAATSCRRNDSGLALPMVAAVAARCGTAPERVLVDTNYATRDDIVGLADDHDCRVYAPPPEPRGARPSAATERRRGKETPAVREWRTRMASPEARDLYRRRNRIETVNAQLKWRGLGRLFVRGLAKAQCVVLLHALAHNLWHGHRLRLAQA